MIILTMYYASHLYTSAIGILDFFSICTTYIMTTKFCLLVVKVYLLLLVGGGGVGDVVHQQECT